MMANENLQDKPIDFSKALVDLVRLSDHSIELEREDGPWGEKCSTESESDCDCNGRDLADNEDAAARAASHICNELARLLGPKAMVMLAKELVAHARAETDNWICYCKRMNRPLAYLEMIQSNLKHFGIPNAPWGGMPPEDGECECMECETGV